MRLGPLSILDRESVEALLKQHHIHYEILINEEMLSESNSQSSEFGRNFHLGNKVLFFEIDEDEFAKVAADLEKYGITQPTDGSYELGSEDD